MHLFRELKSAAPAPRWTHGLLLLTATLLSANPAVNGQAGSSPPPAGTVQEVRIEAPSLEGNLLGDAPSKRALVYLPPGYESQPDRRYPLLVLLHGIFDTPEVWIRHFRIPDLLNEMIAAGDFPPAVVVFPEGGNRLGGGFYRNSPVSGNWADFIRLDLTDFVDTRYRTHRGRGQRALMGHSMGGYGAIHMAMEHPESFSVIYAMSPCCLAPVEDLGHGNPVWGRIVELTGGQQVEEAVRSRDFYLVAGLGILSAFSPNPEKPPFFVEIPFGRERGETVLREPAFSAWVERFPVQQVTRRREALVSLQGLGIDYGTGDQFAHIPAGARLLSERLAEQRIPHRLEVYAGDHRQELRERLKRSVLPWIARHFSTETP